MLTVSRIIPPFHRSIIEYIDIISIPDCMIYWVWTVLVFVYLVFSFFFLSFFSFLFFAFLWHLASFSVCCFFQTNWQFWLRDILSFIMHNKMIIFMITLAVACAAPSNIPSSYNTAVQNEFLTSNCKADGLSPPLGSGTTLPAPPYGQKVLHVAVGRGTQVGDLKTRHNARITTVITNSMIVELHMWFRLFNINS